MKITAEPRSDQWNAEDFMAGPRTFTIAGVKAGGAEQKYDIELVEGEGRVWRPPLTMLRVLIAAWGDNGKDWVGRRVTLFRDPSIKFGPTEVGGIRISHLSHIDKPLAVSLTVTRGRRAPFRVQPLKDTPKPAETTTEPPLDLNPMWSALKVAGITEPSEMLATVKQIIGREIGSSKELTADDMTAVMEDLKTRMAGDHDE